MDMTKGRNRYRHLPVVALLALGLFVSSCANLKAIRGYADSSAEALTYTAFVEDFARSADRLKRYQAATFHSDLERIRQERERLEPQWMALHKVAEEYLKALGELASDELVSFAQPAQSLAAGIKQSGLVKDAHAEAAGKLTKLLADAVSKSYRRKQLSEVIGAANPSFQVVLSALADMVAKDYVASLDNERIAMDKYYQGILMVAEDDPHQAAAVALLKDTIREKRDAITRKQQAATTHGETLAKIAAGHQFLYDNREQLSSDRVQSTISGYRTDIANLYNALKTPK